MDDLAEKRVHAANADASHLAVATGLGLVVIAVSDGRIGEFGVARRGLPTDIAVSSEPGASPRLAVATDKDVLVAAEPVVDALEPSDFGPAVAVTIDGERVVAASPAGRLGVLDGAEWETVAELSAPPTALDGDLVGTATGVYHLGGGTLRPAGLRQVNDLARAAGVPLAATADGLYVLGNGWLDVLAGDVQLVAGAPDGRAHAATVDTLYERVDGEWRPVDRQIDGAAGAVVHGEQTYMFSAAGDLLVDTSDGWATHVLGLDGVRAAALL